MKIPNDWKPGGTCTKPAVDQEWPQRVTMIEKFRLWLQDWLGVTDNEKAIKWGRVARTDLEDKIEKRNREVAKMFDETAHIIGMVSDRLNDLRTEFESRLSELEKSYAQVQYSDAKEVQPEPIMPGHIPFSARKRNWEQSRAQKAADKKPKRST